jgi:hypothetical protein
VLDHLKLTPEKLTDIRAQLKATANDAVNVLGA